MKRLTATQYALMSPSARCQVPAEDRARIRTWFTLTRAGFKPREASRLLELRWRIANGKVPVR